MSHMFGLKHVSRNVLVWKPFILYTVTKHACINAGGIVVTGGKFK